MYNIRKFLKIISIALTLNVCILVFSEVHAQVYQQLFHRLGTIVASYNSWMPKDHLFWDWKSINPEQDNFLENLAPIFVKKSKIPFRWGVATSAYQIEGPDGNQSDWSEWEKTPGHISENNTVGIACDHRNRYKEDTDLIANCGFNSYRMSVDWSKIEPQKGVYNYTMLKSYQNEIRYLKSKGIHVTVCLFHHASPLWFAQKGGWEIEDNIQDFVDFTKVVTEYLHKDIDEWMTINEPAGYAMGSYYNPGKNPPGKKDLLLCGKVVWHLMRAHTASSLAIKEIDPAAQVGIAHIIQHVDTYHRLNPLEKFIAGTFDYLLNDVVINYLKTGEFKWEFSKLFALPQAFAHYRNTKVLKLENSITGFDADAPGSLDFIHVNYYAHTNICVDIIGKIMGKRRSLIGPAPREDKQEITSSNGQIIYPEGLYRAIDRCSILEKPMYIGEIGVSDNNDTLKKMFIRKHLYAAAKAINDGYDVRGCYYWTLMDNWEWAHGYTQKFGLFSVDRNTQERTLYPGAQEFINFVQNRTK